MKQIVIQESILWKHHYENYESLNKLLMNDILQHMKEDPQGAPKSNKLCWRGQKKYLSESQLFKPIHLIVDDWISHYYIQKKFKIKIDYWTNVNEPHSMNVIHNHSAPTSTYSPDLSGVYYVQGKETGDLRFYTHEQLYNLISHSTPYSQHVFYSPNDGDVLLWPSHLHHDVDINISNKKRINIAFNITLNPMEM